MSTPTSQVNSSFVICPHCQHQYQPESEDFDEDEREEECSECGGLYLLRNEMSVTHYTRPLPVP